MLLRPDCLLIPNTNLLDIWSTEICTFPWLILIWSSPLLDPLTLCLEWAHHFITHDSWIARWRSVRVRSLATTPQLAHFWMIIGMFLYTLDARLILSAFLWANSSLIPPYFIRYSFTCLYSDSLATASLKHSALKYYVLDTRFKQTVLLLFNIDILKCSCENPLIHSNY